jgi:hypothetical protein
VPDRSAARGHYEIVKSIVFLASMMLRSQQSRDDDIFGMLLRGTKHQGGEA